MFWQGSEYVSDWVDYLISGFVRVRSFINNTLKEWNRSEVMSEERPMGWDILLNRVKEYKKHLLPRHFSRTFETLEN